MKQLILPFLVLVAIILFAYWSSQPGNLERLLSKTTQNLQGEKSQKEKIVKIGKAQFKVEIAQTEEERKKGLSGRDSLAPDSGMLFVLEKDSKPSFWMKGVKFPIDIIWIDNTKVAEITPNTPTPNTQDPEIPTYSPQKPASHVLEIPAGEAEKKEIKVGDKVELPN